MRPIIGILCREVKSVKGKLVLGVYENYIKAVEHNKGIPFIIVKPTRHILDFCNGFLLPGGDDPTDRDFQIIKYAIKNDKPILGICLGMQAMAIYSSKKKLVNTDNHYMNEHTVYLYSKSKLGKMFAKEITVNSRHISKVESIGKYNIVEYAKDGTIEAVEYDNNKFNIGAEWHPEDLENQQKLFKKFIKA